MTTATERTEVTVPGSIPLRPFKHGGLTMLFLATATLRDMQSVPRERVLGLVASTWATIDQLEQDGKVVVGGAAPGIQSAERREACSRKSLEASRRLRT